VVKFFLVLSTKEGGTMKKILVVDDDKNIRIIFTKFLKQLGHDVETASTGGQALELILEKQYDLIILDIKMPDMHGLEVLNLLRDSGISTPVIMCTAFEGMKDDFVVKSSSVVDYLVKPVDLRVLGETVKKALVATE
jgi:CheY-like chemotaxis protein